MSMTKKDYELVADVFADAFSAEAAGEKVTINDVMADLIDAFKEDNTSFDADRFYAYMLENTDFGRA